LASGRRLGKTRDLRRHPEEVLKKGAHVQLVGELRTREYGNKEKFAVKQRVCKRKCRFVPRSPLRILSLGTLLLLQIGAQLGL
jgi:hypothetical protein